VAEGRRDQPSARPVSKEFRKAWARGGIAADAKVARALYQRSIGYSQRATKVFMPAGAKGRSTLVMLSVSRRMGG